MWFSPYTCLAKPFVCPSADTYPSFEKWPQSLILYSLECSNFSSSSYIIFSISIGPSQIHFARSSESSLSFGFDLNILTNFQIKVLPTSQYWISASRSLLRFSDSTSNRWQPFLRYQIKSLNTSGSRSTKIFPFTFFTACRPENMASRDELGI